MSNIKKHRFDDEIPEEYQNLADRTAQDMVVDHIYAAYDIIKSIHPEISGFQAKIVENPDDPDQMITTLDLMKKGDVVK